MTLGHDGREHLRFSLNILKSNKRVQTTPDLGPVETDSDNTVHSWLTGPSKGFLSSTKRVSNAVQQAFGIRFRLTENTSIFGHLETLRKQSEKSNCRFPGRLRFALFSGGHGVSTGTSSSSATSASIQGFLACPKPPSTHTGASSLHPFSSLTRGSSSCTSRVGNPPESPEQPQLTNNSKSLKTPSRLCFFACFCGERTRASRNSFSSRIHTSCPGNLKVPFYLNPLFRIKAKEASSTHGGPWGPLGHFLLDEAESSPGLSWALGNGSNWDKETVLSPSRAMRPLGHISLGEVAESLMTYLGSCGGLPLD
ncbi:hypothetical protein CRG98_029946 [Punica granatum]|uniref:Uncharacterized protein n=1 Tax=Punica granatum TaxID=22663 RepID=A0A2I0J0C4_PUNGR|nr:hypothetical protein CRG98_029946 [Punica granatum]